MKYLKLFTLAALAAMALMAVVGIGTASATTLDGPGGAMLNVGAEIDLSAQGSVVVKNTSGSVLATCANSTIKLKTLTTGSDLGEPVKTAVEAMTWVECSATIDTVKKGTASVSATSGSNGTVTSAETEVTYSSFGTSCTYGASAGATLGTLAGGSPGVLTEHAALTKTGGSLLCTETVVVEAEYTVTAPTTLTVTGP